jgi:hypothetical protein
VQHRGVGLEFDAEAERTGPQAPGLDQQLVGAEHGSRSRGLVEQQRARFVEPGLRLEEAHVTDGAGGDIGVGRAAPEVAIEGLEAAARGHAEGAAAEGGLQLPPLTEADLGGMVEEAAVSTVDADPGVEARAVGVGTADEQGAGAVALRLRTLEAVLLPVDHRHAGDGVGIDGRGEGRTG